MLKGWMALAVGARVAGGLMWGVAQPAEAAIVIGGGVKANMSLVEPAARKKRSRVQCTDYLLWTCCKAPGKPESCRFKIM